MRRWQLGMVILLLTGAPGAVLCGSDRHTDLRQRMVAIIQEDVERTSAYIDKEALDLRVMEAMAMVPRHEFVPPDIRGFAYQNRPLPIGHGQTISQPYIVALMTDLLKTSSHSRVLEVGTGSGYQAAILAALVDQVYSIEIIEALAKQAQNRFAGLNITNINTRIADGYYGWPEQAPFDAIIVTAAAGHIPPPLIAQLKPGGRMVIPVGSWFATQQLLLITKTSDSRITTRQILPVRFVPLTGGH